MALHSSHPEFRGQLTKVSTHTLKSRLGEKDARRIADEANWRAVCKEVDQRDGNRCRACGRKLINAIGLQINGREHHHIIFRSAGGPDTIENVCLTCKGCHDAVHVSGVLRIDGNAQGRLTFGRLGEDGRWTETLEPAARVSVTRGAR
jgi:hypothetical protein